MNSERESIWEDQCSGMEDVKGGSVSLKEYDTMNPSSLKLWVTLVNSRVSDDIIREDEVINRSKMAGVFTKMVNATVNRSSPKHQAVTERSKD